MTDRPDHLHIRRGKPTLLDLDRLPERHGGLIAAQLATPPERWSAELAADVASIATSDFTIVLAAGRDVDTSLDILLVARRP